jgi:Na+/alanine symporter
MKTMIWSLFVFFISMFGVVMAEKMSWSIINVFCKAMLISGLLLTIVLTKSIRQWHKERTEKKSFEINFYLRRRVE